MGGLLTRSLSNLGHTQNNLLASTTPPPTNQSSFISRSPTVASFGSSPNPPLRYSQSFKNNPPFSSSRTSAKSE